MFIHCSHGLSIVCQSLFIGDLGLPMYSLHTSSEAHFITLSQCRMKVLWEVSVSRINTHKTEAVHTWQVWSRQVPLKLRTTRRRCWPEWFGVLPFLQ